MERAGAFDCAHRLSVRHARGREEGEGGISPFSMSIKTTSAQKTRDNRRRGDARGGAVKWWGNPCKTVKMAPPPTCPKGVSTRVHHQLSRIHYISPSSAHTHNHGAQQQQLTHRIKKKQPRTTNEALVKRINKWKEETTKQQQQKKRAATIGTLARTQRTHEARHCRSVAMARKARPPGTVATRTHPPLPVNVHKTIRNPPNNGKGVGTSER